MLEGVRKKLRSLVRLIDKTHCKLLSTDFTDEIGDESIVGILGITPQLPMDQFREKVRAFLRQHQDDLAIYRLRSGRQVTAPNLISLERLVGASGIGDDELLRQAAQEAQGLGLFLRRLVGLDRGAVKEAFALGPPAVERRAGNVLPGAELAGGQQRVLRQRPGLPLSGPAPPGVSGLAGSAVVGAAQAAVRVSEHPGAGDLVTGSASCAAFAFGVMVAVPPWWDGVVRRVRAGGRMGRGRDAEGGPGA
jgi:EcoEI R protein C-terminal